jgi:hypothetical protein
MPASNPRIVKAALKLSPIVALMIAQCLAIVAAMTGNAYFSAPNPTLAVITAAIQALSLSQQGAMARTRGAAGTRNLDKKALIKLMNQLCAYVQAIANSLPGQELAVIVSAKMEVAKSSGGKPRGWRALQGDVSGSADLEAPRVAARKSVQWQWSVDQKSWTDLSPTLKSSTTVSNLTPGTTYYFRYRVLTKDGLGDWSQVVSLFMH